MVNSSRSRNRFLSQEESVPFEEGIHSFRKRNLVLLRFNIFGRLLLVLFLRVVAPLVLNYNIG